MSLRRFVFYSAVVSGWAGYLAWLVCEVLFLHTAALSGVAQTVLTAATVGAAVAAGLNLVAGRTNPQWSRQLGRLVPGLVGGALGGAVGGLLGTLMYAALGLPRAIGWAIMGLTIGSADGLYERSPIKARNGLIGGALGGFLGGLLFDPIASAGAEMSSRALAFVILGLSIGALVGLTQVVLKEAWLTVEDGFLPGRELILSQAATTLGRGDHLPLPFLGPSGKDLETQHATITRQPSGTYVIEDNRTRLGTRVNGNPIRGPVTLQDGDLIRLGGNVVRFHHRRRPETVAPGEAAAVAPPGPSVMPAPPPPPTGAPPYVPPESRPSGPPPLPRPACSSPPQPPRIPPPPPPPG